MIRTTQKPVSGPHSKASPASSSLQAALWEDFGVGWKIRSLSNPVAVMFALMYTEEYR